jgi:hypothetical protein
LPSHFSSGFVGFIGAFVEVVSDGLGIVDCVGLQGAELMGKYGINVPRGAAAGSAQEVKDALKNVFPSEKEVTMPQLPYLMLFHLIHSVDAKCQPPIRRVCRSDSIGVLDQNVVYFEFILSRWCIHSNL